MTVEEAEVHLRTMLLDAGFDFTRPDVALAWEVFKQFAVVPVESGSDREGEVIWFEAYGGDSERGRRGYFEFVRLFSQFTEADAIRHGMITLHFECEPEAYLGLWDIIPADMADLPAFYRAVESSQQFRAGLAFSGWSL